MSKGRFILLLSVLTGTAVFLLLRQYAEIEQVKQALAQRQFVPPAASQSSLKSHEPRPSPSSELLRLRNEVTMLNRELKADVASPAHNVIEARAEWDEIHSGRALSEQPGFIPVRNLTHAGNTTPAQAFQSFQFAVRNQHQEPLTPTRMKEIWDVPDDFDDPNARYSISMGQGIGGETGYLIADVQLLSSNEVKLIVDFETKDGGSFRQDRVLVYRDGRWRVKPESVTVAD